MVASALGASPNNGPTLWSNTNYKYGVSVSDVGNIIVWVQAKSNGAWASKDLSTIPGNPMSLPLDHMDSHEVPSICVDPDGYIHVAGNNWENSDVRIVKSTSPNNITAWTDEHTDFALSAEASDTTYVRFAPLPNNDVIAFQRLREVGTGSGQPGSEWCFVKQAGQSNWTPRGKILGGLVTTQDAFYRSMHIVDKNGRVHLFGAWDQAYGAGTVVDDHSYLYSDDAGVTWKNIAGTALTLPIDRESASGVAIRTGQRFGDPPRNLYAMGCAVDANGYPCHIYVDQDNPATFPIVRWTGSAWMTDTTSIGAWFRTGSFTAQLINWRGDLWCAAKEPNPLMTLRRVASPHETINLLGNAPPSWFAWPDPIALRDRDVIELFLVDEGRPRIYTLGDGTRRVAS